MTIIAGTSPISQSAIASSIAGTLKLPVDTSTPIQAPVQQNYVQAPVQPNYVQAPVQPNYVQPTPVIPPIVTREAVNGVELPSFEDTPIEPVEPSADVIDDDSDLPDVPGAENFRKLRGVVKAEREAKIALTAELTETKSKLESYEKGENKPEVLEAKDRRIAELEPYEKVINLKMSPEYQESFVQPAIELRNKLEKLGEDYGISKELMHTLVGIDNKKDLNRLIANYFQDSIGGTEVRDVITELQDLGGRAIEAEKAPQETMQSLRSQYADKQREEIIERNKVFEHVAKTGWQKALDKTKAEGAYPELILHPSNTQYNKEVVEPIQARAATQYGALIKQLAANGLKTIPDELAVGLARMVQLSIGGALSLQDKNKATDRANKIIADTSRVKPYMKPTLGGSNGTGHSVKANQDTGPSNPMDAAKIASSHLR